MKQFNKKNYKVIINIVLDIIVFLFSIILIISIYSGIQTKILGKNYADFFGYSIFEVQTGSMEPVIKAGDWIIVKLTNDIKLNDIVTYESNGDFITHRVIEVYKNTYVTMGDANNAKDGIVNKEQTVGCVVKIIGGLGIVKKVLFNPGVLIAMFITIVMGIFAFRKKDNSVSNEKIKETKLFNNLMLKIKEIVNNRKNENNSLDNIFEDEKINKNEKLIDEKVNKNISKSSENENIDKGLLDELENNEIVDEKLEEDNLINFSQISGNKIDDYQIENLDELSDEELEQELAKTSIYREILVDKSEINNTLLEIANNQVDNDVVINKNENFKVVNAQKVEETPDDEIDLSALNTKKGRHHSKNIIDKVMNVKREQISEIILCLTFEASKEVNETSIENKFIDAYINANYFNNYSEVSVNYNISDRKAKNIKFIKDYGKKIVNDYKGPDTNYSDKVSKYVKIMSLISSLDDAHSAIDDTKIKLQFYNEKVEEYINDLHITFTNSDELGKKILKIQKNYDGIINYLLKKLETTVFSLELNEINTKKDMYAIKLNHNISFNRVYSDYIVDKTYNGGIIAEDKVNVLLNLLSLEFIKNIMDGDFKKKYVLYIPASMYAKKKKFESLLDTFESDFVKNHIVILLTCDVLQKNITFINKLRKNGYHFALYLEEDGAVELSYNDLYISEYIFVNNKKDDFVKRLLAKNNELSEKIIADNISEKIGDFEVESL